MNLRSTLPGAIAILLICTLSLAAGAADYASNISNAIEARNRGDMPEAELLLREAYREASDKREAAYLLGLVLAFQEKFDESMSLLDDALVSYPRETSLLLARARVLSYQGEYAASLQVTEQVLAENPANTEAANLAGRVNAYRNRWDDARRHFNHVLMMDPGNLEAIVGLHDVALYSGNTETAEEWLQRAEAIAPDRADVIARRDRSAGDVGPEHQLMFGWGLATIDRRGFDNWYDRFLEYRHGSSGQNQQSLRIEHAHRFGNHDSFIEGALHFADLPLDVSAGFGIEEDFLPAWRFGIASSFSLVSGSETIGSMVGRLAYHHSRYDTGHVRSLSLDVDYYYREMNGWLSPGLILTRDELGDTNSGWRLYTHHQVHRRWRIGAGYISAPETENARTTDTETVHAYAIFRFADHWDARLDVSRHDRDKSYRRRTAILSMTYRF